MIKRAIVPAIQEIVGKFPVLTITGPRQSGKTTLIRELFPELPYFSLENPDTLARIEKDPRGLFRDYGHRMVLDEVQRLPELLSYIQGIVDDDREALFVLSGSHNLLMMESVSQTLAGRAAIFFLQPLSVSELLPHLPQKTSPYELIFSGGYPRIFDRELLPTQFYPSYLATYVERDVRQVRNIGDLDAFRRFIGLCAGFIGQTINHSTLAETSGIHSATVNAWLSVLKTSHIIYTLQPYYRNFKKRLVKSSKLYFRDTGLACSLLGITSVDQLLHYYQRGALFENFAINEVAKGFYNRALPPNFHFWRDNAQHEIDLLLTIGGQLRPVEIKSSATYSPKFTKQLNWLAGVADVPLTQPTVLYGGEQTENVKDALLLSWREADQIVEGG